MKNPFTLCVVFTTFFTSFFLWANVDQPRLSATNSYFEQVKARVFSDPYESLPQYDVSKRLFDKGDENILLKHALRTLESTSDFVTLETGQKLLQANGICFAGTWKTNTDSPYTGLYAANTELPVIVRASVSLSGTKQNDKRAFGVAIKLFPPLNDTQEEAKSHNIFLMHSLGGTKTDHVLSLPMTNEPSMGSIPPFGKIFTALRLEKDLEAADTQFSGEYANARFRPVSHIAQVGVDGANLVAPHWLKLTVADTVELVDQDDFRNELTLKNYTEHKFAWIINAARYNDNGIDNAEWLPIGSITVTQSIVSETCDQRLHFAHPSILSGAPR